MKFYELFLTWRYLTRRPLSLVAVGALGLSVAALVVAPSIMNGFQAEFHKRIRGTLSDLTLSAARPFGIAEDPELERFLAGLPHVEAVAPYIENPALDKHLSKIDYCFLRGIDPQKEAEVSRFEDYLLSPRETYLSLYEDELEGDPLTRQSLLELAESLPDEVDQEGLYRLLEEGDPERPGLPTCIVGIYFLRAWNMQVGDTVLLTTASEAGEVAQDVEFLIVGAFRTGFSEKDRRGVICSLDALQDFVDVPGRVSGYSMRLDDYEQAPAVKAALADAVRKGKVDLPTQQGYFIRTWEEHNQTLLQAVAMEKLLIRLLTFFIVFMASASIFLVLFISVYTKIRELGILRAVGSTWRGVLTVFIGQGLLIAFVGMAVGLAIGVAFSWNINEIADVIHATTGWHPFPPEVYYLDRIPTRIDPEENAVNFVATLILGGLAAFIPGILAALRPPLKAIRYE